MIIIQELNTYSTRNQNICLNLFIFFKEIFKSLNKSPTNSKLTKQNSKQNKLKLVSSQKTQISLSC